MSNITRFMHLIELWEQASDAEEEIAAIEAALAIESTLLEWPFQEPREQVMGRLLIGLGDAYAQRVQGSPPDNVETAITCYEATLSVWTRESIPDAWAEVQLRLANAYAQRIHGSRAENLDKAITTYENILTLKTRDAFPHDWARTLSNLAMAYLDRISGQRADNLEKALAACQASLTVLTRDELPEEWATAQIHLGNVYLCRVSGNRADNLESAIAVYESALSIFTRSAFPASWALAQSNLGEAYRDRIHGEQADNLELALRAYEAALSVFSPDATPRDWARTMNNLALVYRRRILGDRSRNIELAIEAYEATLAVRTRDAFPQHWAQTQSNLGLAYMDRRQGKRADNVEQAIARYNAALTVLTPAAFPEDWASVHINLGSALRDRLVGNATDNRRQAIAAYKTALPIVPREAAPQRWATAQHNLGGAYFDCDDGARAENIEQAIQAYTAALTVFECRAFPRDHLRTGRRLGHALLAKRDWRGADSAYASARDAFHLLFGTGLNEDESHDLLAEAGPLFREAAFAAAEMGERWRALSLLTEGKARLMSLALRQQAMDLSPEDKQHHAALTADIRIWMQTAESATGSEGAAALQHLISLREELGILLAGNAPVASHSHDTTVPIAPHLVPEGGAILAPIVTDVGGKVFIITAATGNVDVAVVDLPELGTDGVNEFARGPADEREFAGWFGAFSIQYLPGPQYAARMGEWLAAIDALGPTLWHLVGESLYRELESLGVQQGSRIIWLPTGILGVVPIGLAQDPTSGRRLGEMYELVYVPSFDALTAAVRQVATPARDTLAAIANPTGDLAFTEIELRLVARHFDASNCSILVGGEATAEAALTSLEGKAYWHFSCHGLFDWQNAKHSALLMSGAEPLTVRRLLLADRLGRPRLVVLSACETGLNDFGRSPDEFIGLPSAFMALGAAGVLSTLWQVDDRATALLIARFYDLHMGQHLSPPAALKGAQSWLRTTPRRELVEYAMVRAAHERLDSMLAMRLEASLMRGDPENTRFPTTASATTCSPDCPFAHPYYWGAFIYTGL